MPAERFDFIGVQGDGLAGLLDSPPTEHAPMPYSCTASRAERTFTRRAASRRH